MAAPHDPQLATLLTLHADARGPVTLIPSSVALTRAADCFGQALERMSGCDVRLCECHDGICDGHRYGRCEDGAHCRAFVRGDDL